MSFTPVAVPAVGNNCEATFKDPTSSARATQPPPGCVVAVSLLTTQAISANALPVTVVTDGVPGLVSFCRLAQLPAPVEKLTSCGVTTSTPDSAPIQYITGSE